MFVMKEACKINKLASNCAVRNRKEILQATLIEKNFVIKLDGFCDMLQNK